MDPCDAVPGKCVELEKQKVEVSLKIDACRSSAHRVLKEDSSHRRGCACVS